MVLNPYKWRGFTLLELLIAIVIAALMVSAISVTVGRTGRYHVRSSASQLASGLKFARNQAIAKGISATLMLNTETASFNVTGRDQPVQLSDDLTYKLVTATGEQLNDKTGNIRFYPDGSATGGHIEVSVDTALRTLINVDWLTGRVWVEEDE